MQALFISDLHLDACRPEVTACFLRFLAGSAREARTLYILGDLFETWVGDDAADEHQRKVIDGLRAYTEAGHRCRFMHGNRDLLIGERFASETGVRLLAEPARATIGDTPAILLHGDRLCTDDRSYQRFRQIVHNRALQRLFLRLPVGQRRSIARWLRTRSSRQTARKPLQITDVTQTAVEALMREHQIRLLIHGHTHRPGIHDFELDGMPARRIVLGDWYTQGSVLQWQQGQPELRELAC